jgi:hypothetical protein
MTTQGCMVRLTRITVVPTTFTIWFGSVGRLVSALTGWRVNLRLTIEKSFTQPKCEMTHK